MPTTSNNQRLPINWAMLSLLQYSFAILVICLHSGRIFPQDGLHFIQKSLFSRLAVPFFVISSTFLLRYQIDQKLENKTIIFLKITKTYLFWSVIFLPYLIHYINQNHLPIWQWPLAILIALLYAGSCYHLWYLPAYLMGGIFIDWLRNHFKEKLVIILSVLLFFFGLLETYSAYLLETPLGQLYETYRNFFWTARNGLFYMPAFICLGHLAYQSFQQSASKLHHKYLLIASAALFILEGRIIFINQGIDKNFFVSLLPLSFFLFQWAIRTPLLKNHRFKKLKVLSRYYYFIHPIFIELGFFLFPSKNRQDWDKGILVFFFSLIGTHLLALIIINLQKNKTDKLSNLSCKNK